MPPSRLLLATCLVATTATLTWYWSRVEPPHPPQSASPATTEPTPTPPSAATPASETERLRLLASPQAREQERRLAFHNRYRTFIEQAGTADSASRQLELRELQQRIDELEARGELALSEALVMQLGLIRAAHDDESLQQAQAAALVQRYQQLSASREVQQPANPDFDRYKAEEKRIVDEVMALQDIPDGLTRDQYLRQRLQQARERNYP